MAMTQQLTDFLIQLIVFVTFFYIIIEILKILKKLIK